MSRWTGHRAAGHRRRRCHRRPRVSSAGVDNYPAAFAGITAAGGASLSPASSGQGRRGFAGSAWSLGVTAEQELSFDVRLAKPLYQSDSGCAGRAYADVSADADPATGLKIYDSGNGGWLLMGGTSLATPLVAAFSRSPAWDRRSRRCTSSALLKRRSRIGLERQLCPEHPLHLQCRR